MDLRTGKTYDSLEDALAAGVPESDIAEVRDDPEQPEVRVKNGPFKGRVYKRNDRGQLVRVS